MRLREYLWRRQKAVLFAAAALTIGCALGVAAVATGHLHSGAWPMASIKEAAHSGSEDARGYSRVVKEVLPAVVNISSSRVTKQETSGMQGQPSMDPFFRQFFGRRGVPPFQHPEGTT